MAEAEQTTIKNRYMRFKSLRWYKALALPAMLALSACDPTVLQTKTAPTKTVVEGMPEIAGIDHLGRNFSLAEAREKGPVVVVFYRGHW